MKILQLDSGLFPDQEAVRVAVLAIENGEHTVSRIAAAEISADDDAAWDAVVQKILAADKVVTV
ncbi:MAG: hypothetical protein HN403_20240 [Rhodospirillales bacterium]|jgi:hypothetical protein|nr:hypothetical protein [Rhodospirillales bacterium]MBT7943692.1 hypothetical protein [Alphaproteobacteria bacterium]